VLEATPAQPATRSPSRTRRLVGGTGTSPALDGLLVALATISVSAFAWFWPSTTVDEISLLVYGDVVGGGRVPNRDFFTPYGPGSYWPLAGLNWLFSGPSVALERGLALSYHVAVALAVWSLCRRFGRMAALVAGGLSGILTAGLLLVAYPWLLAAAATTWACSAAIGRRWALAGFLAAIGCTVRPEFLIVAGPTLAILLPSWGTARRLALGILVGGAGLWWHLAVAGGDMIQNVFVARLNGDNRLPLPPDSPVLTAALAGLVVATLFLVVRAAVLRTRPDVATAALVVLLLPQAFQRADRDHFLFVACVLVPVAVAALIPETFRESVGAEAVGRASLVLTALLGLMLLAVSPRGDVVHVSGRSLITKSPAASSWVRTVVGEVQRQAPEGERVFVGATDMSRAALSSNYIYYLLPDRVPDAYFLEMAPGISEKAGSGLLSDVRGSDVLVLTHFESAQRRHVVPYVKPGSPEVNDYVQRHFCRVSESFEVRILRRCD
jgi:hypothetical protein